MIRPVVAGPAIVPRKRQARSAPALMRPTQATRGAGMPSLGEFPGHFREPAPKGEAKHAFRVVQTAGAGIGCMVAGTVRGSSARCGPEAGFRERQADHQHAVVQKRNHHRKQRGLLATVQRGTGGEHRSRFAGQSAALPQASGAVPEVLHGGGHVAESRWTAQCKAGAFDQVGVLAVGCSRWGNRRRRTGSHDCDGWHGP